MISKFYTEKKKKQIKTKCTQRRSELSNEMKKKKKAVKNITKYEKEKKIVTEKREEEKKNDLTQKEICFHFIKSVFFFLHCNVPVTISCIYEIIRKSFNGDV